MQSTAYSAFENLIVSTLNTLKKKKKTLSEFLLKRFLNRKNLDWVASLKQDIAL